MNWNREYNCPCDLAGDYEHVQVCLKHSPPVSQDMGLSCPLYHFSNLQSLAGDSHILPQAEGLYMDCYLWINLGAKGVEHPAG